MIPLLLAALLGCGDPGDAAKRALAEPASDPVRALALCDEQAFDQMRVLCRIEAAAAAGRAGHLETAEQACQQVPEGTWRKECHFRAGEELARGGHPVQAVSHCARAGRFTRFCVTHAAWALPPEAWMDEPIPGADLAARLDAQLVEIESAAQDLDAQLRPEALATFRMRLWFNAYYGTGRADPEAARAAPAHQRPQAHSAFMMEAARLLAPHGEGPPPDAVELLIAAWRSEGAALEGEPMPFEGRHGRYAVPIPVPQERDLERIPLYGGGRRIVGEEADEDLIIAALEALWFRPDTPAEPFLPWVDEPRERIRWTAARLLRLSEPRALDMQATLEALTQHADPGVAWNAKDGLQHRTWERKPGGPR